MTPPGDMLGEGELPLNKTLLSASIRRSSFVHYSEAIQLKPPSQEQRRSGGMDL